ncbi:MAG: amidohydrolase family protein, partial [Geminicoccaceae bacterium]|nr:amidohydrolase family protein [Geminicoccaceae bacterium]
MERAVIRHAAVWDGESKSTFKAEVEIAGERIARIARDGASIGAEGATVIDGSGMTLMPGMVEG